MARKHGPARKRGCHGKGDHEFNAGTMILKKCLDKLPNIVTAAYYNGWPADPTAFDNADSILLYMDGGGGHPVIQRNRLAEIDQLIAGSPAKK